MAPKHWTDQPDAVESMNVLLSFHLPDVGAVEFRAGPKGYTMTTGNLFGSQTVMAADLATLLAVLNQAVRARDGDPEAQVLLPDAATLMDNAYTASGDQEVERGYEEEEVL